MGQYIFTFPADTPELTYETLAKYIGPPGSVRKIGTTVTVEHYGDKSVQFVLYDTALALIFADRVYFLEHGDRHKATGEWLSRIVSDNGIGNGVCRENFKLFIGFDSDKPVEGHNYPTRIAERRELRARIAAHIAHANAALNAEAAVYIPAEGDTVQMPGAPELWIPGRIYTVDAILPSAIRLAYGDETWSIAIEWARDWGLRRVTADDR